MYCALRNLKTWLRTCGTGSIPWFKVADTATAETSHLTTKGMKASVARKLARSMSCLMFAMPLICASSSKPFAFSAVDDHSQRSWQPTSNST